MTFAPIETAVIGYGFSAKTFHIPFITSLPEFELAAISSSQREQVLADWPTVDCYSSAQDLIAQSDAQLVIITSPNSVHFELAKAALESGKHVVLEKPFVTRVEDGEALIKLAREKGKILSVYHNRRWDGDFLTVKQMLDDKAFGELKHYESHFDRFRPQVRQRWREQASDGGGVLFDLGPHLIDQALALFGVPNAISAQCEIMREGSNNVDYFNVVLHYDNHLAILHCDLFTAGQNKRFTIKGTKGSFEKCGLDPQEPRLIAGALPIDESWAAETPNQYGTFYDGANEKAIQTQTGGYQHYFTQLAEAITTNAIPPVTAEDALLTIKLIELAIKSSQTGRRLTLANEFGRQCDE